MSRETFMVFSIFGLLVAGCGFTALQGQSIKRLDETKDFRSDSMFHFTISPDDRWMVFFKRMAEEEVGTRHWSMGNLRLLDLKTGTLQKFTLSEEVGPEPLCHGDASWSADASHCVLPPPQSVPASPEKAILIDVHDPANIRVVPVRVTHGENPGVQAPGQEFAAPESYTCSDCFPHTNDVELMKKHIDPRYLHWGDLSINRNDVADQIVSPDGTKIYYQTGPEQREWDELTLHEFDIATGKERTVVSHRGDCPRINHLRPAPDGKQLAYQLFEGCTSFISEPIICLLDLQTGRTRQIARASGGTMHWTSTSDRLFYYHDEYLWVAEFPKSAQSQPAATQPVP